MVVEAERLLVSVVSKGVDGTKRKFNDMRNSVVQSSAGVKAFGDTLDSAGRDAVGLSGTMQVLQGRLDEVGDEFDETDRSASGARRALAGFVGAAMGALGPITALNAGLDETEDELDEVRNSALGASGAMNTYTGSSLSAALATYTMHDALIAGAIPSLIVLLSTLGPLVGVVGALTAGLLGLAGGFGVVLGTGALAWFQQTEDAMGQLQAVLDELIAIGVEFGQQFVPLIDAAIGAVPELARRLVDATGDMSPFVDELLRLGSAAMDVLPRMLAWFMDIGREAIPVWRDFTTWVGEKTPDALEFFRSVVSRTWDSIHELSLALLDALGTFTEFGVVATNVVAPMLVSILGGFESLLEFVMDLPPGIRDMTVAFAALAPIFTIGAVAAAEFLRLLKGFSATFTTANTALARLTPAFGTMVGALAILGAAVLGFAELYERNFAGIADATNRVARVFKEELVATFQTAKEVLIPIINDIANAFTTFFLNQESDIESFVTVIENTLVAGIRGAGESIRGTLRLIESLWEQHSGKIVPVAQQTYQTVASVIRTVIGGISTAIQITLQSATRWWRNHGQQIVEPIRTGYNLVARIITDILGTLQSTSQTKLGIIESFWNQHGKQVVTIIRSSMSLVNSVLNTVFGVLTSIAQDALTGLTLFWQHSGQHWVETIGNVTNTIIRIFTTFGGMLVDVLAPVLDRISAFWRQHGEDIELIVNTLATAVIGIVSGFTTAISEIIRRTLETIRVLVDVGLWVIEALWNKFGDEIVAVIEFAADAIISVVGAFIDTIATLIRAGTAAWNGDWDEAWNQMAGLVRRIASGIVGFISKWVSRLVSYFVSLKDKAVSLINGLWSDAKSAFLGMMGDAKDAVTNGTDDVVSAVGDLVEDALSEVTDMKNRFKSAGKGLIKAFAKGIKNAASEATDAVENVMDNAESYLTGSDADEGPLDNVTEQGGGLPEAFATGMVKNVRVVGKAAETVARYARPELAADGIGPIPAEGSAGNTYNIKVDARGSDNPERTRNESKRGLAAALEAENVRS